MTTPINNFPGISQPNGAGTAAPLAGARPDGQAEDNDFGDLFENLLALVGGPVQDAAKGALGLTQSSNNSFSMALGNTLGLDINLTSDDQDPSALLDALKSLIGGDSDQAGELTQGLQDLLGLETPQDLQDLLGAIQQISGLAGDLIPGAQPTAEVSQTVAGLAEKLLGFIESAQTAGTSTPTTPLPQPVNEALSALDNLLKALPQSEENDALLARLNAVAPQSAGKNADADPEIANIVSALFGDKQAQKDLSAVKPSSSTLALAKPEVSSETLQAAATTGATNKADLQANAPATFGEQAQANNQQNAASGFAAQMQLATQSDGAAEPAQDPLLVGQTSTKVQNAQQMRMATAPYQAAAQHVNVPHVAVEMMRNIRQGATRFEIQLDPPEMGRIDVKLDIDRTGNLSARMSVERPETLELLQRDARALERALAQAGLDTGKTNLEFSLKQNPFNQQTGQQDQDDSFFGGLAANAQAESEPDNSLNNNIIHYRGTLSPGGVNMVA